MELTVNGQPHRTAAATVAGLLDELGHGAGQGTGFIAVALNHEVVRRQNWMAAALKPGDRIEIVSPRQGG